MNIYTQQKLFDSFLGIKFTPSVPDSEFKYSRDQLLLEGKVVRDKNGKDTSHPSYGKKHSPETKRRMSEAHSGEKHHMYGKTHSPETKKQMSESKFGTKLSPETKRRMSESRTGERNPMYGKTGEKNPRYGTKHSEETKKKISESQSGANNTKSKKAIVTWKGKEYVVDYLKEFIEKYLPEMKYSTLHGIIRRGTYSKKYQVSAKYV